MGGNGGGGNLSGDLFDDREFVGHVWESELVEGAEFRNCTFTDVSFAGASLASCLFHECTFTRCDLAGMKIPDTAFSGCRFIDCRLVGVNWTEGRWPKRPLHGPNSFRQCDLSMSTFAGLDLTGSRFDSCKAHDVGFFEAQLMDVDFEGTDLSGADFDRADLSGARLVGTPGVTLDVRTSRIGGATMDVATAMRTIQVLGIVID